MSAKKIENLKVGDKIRIIKMYKEDNSRYNGDIVIVTNVGNHYPEIFSCNEIEDIIDTESDECERVKAVKKPLLKRFKNNTLVRIIKNDKYPETGYPSRYYEKSIDLVGYTQHKYNDHYYTLWSKQDSEGEYYGFFVRSELEEIGPCELITMANFTGGTHEIKATDTLSREELRYVINTLREATSISFLYNNINNSKKGGIMSCIRLIPARIKRLLNSNFKSFYSLGWVDEELNITSDGRTALIDVIFDKFEKELGVAASTEVKRLKKLEKKEAK